MKVSVVVMACKFQAPIERRHGVRPQENVEAELRVATRVWNFAANRLYLVDELEGGSQ